MKKCTWCQQPFEAPVYRLNLYLPTRKDVEDFCSRSCAHEWQQWKMEETMTQFRRVAQTSIVCLKESD